ncbi:hypothetical protein AYO20_00688 [Fonsecaea nubica]|uniref:BZIP domain-containing protein n=1 Tax=Fonsecaea nubica TaxID=856822 RepID=A0A178DDC4_9EURO|nr:hypothetical protein AYO20_00688 [Fonsecaea nubica]OAL39776.1 hypothetical protein AYO20_00688 [Fonsecaea nubica]
MGDMNEVKSVPLELGWETALPDVNLDFFPNIVFWNEKVLACCVCGESLGSQCGCIPSSAVSRHDPNSLGQSPTERSNWDPTDLDTRFTRLEPEGKEEPNPTAPTRKERRRQQNRAAQVRHRNKRNRFLHETLRSIDSLSEELEHTRAQRDYFKLMYEDLETQLLEIRGQANSKFHSNAHM